MNKTPVIRAHQKSDTSVVIELAIHTAFDRNKLPSIDPLKKAYHNGDSILFTSDTRLLTLLPRTVDTLKFKVLTRQHIMELVSTENDLKKVPNYLNIRTFEKNASGYYLSLQSLSAIGFGAGGQIGIYIEKRNDSLIVTKTVSSNIN